MKPTHDYDDGMNQCLLLEQCCLTEASVRYSPGKQIVFTKSMVCQEGEAVHAYRLLLGFSYKNT